MSNLLSTFAKKLDMTVQKPWFKEWFNSPYYYRLYFERNTIEAAEFIDKLINYLKPKAASFMLDVGCGKGRHSVQLASRGFDVTGIDLSEKSIQIAKRKETDRLHFFIHDMRLPFWINYFDCAFNFFTSFGYFNTKREHHNALRTVAQSLRPNGIFVIDYLNVLYAEDHLNQQSEIEIDGVNYHLTKWHDETNFYKEIIIKDKTLNEPLVFREKVMKFSLGDFTEMLSRQQMQVEKVFGDYSLSDYEVKKSPRMIIIAKKIIPDS